MSARCLVVQRREELPELLYRNSQFSQGLANSFDSHVKKLAAPLGRVKKELVISWHRGRI